jgi:hypothetical protein
MTQVNSRLGSQNTIKVIPSIGAATIGALRDVDTSNLGNGYVLVYDSATKKWVATDQLTPGETQNLIINGGNF